MLMRQIGICDKRRTDCWREQAFGERPYALGTVNRSQVMPLTVYQDSHRESRERAVGGPLSSQALPAQEFGNLLDDAAKDRPFHDPPYEGDKTNLTWRYGVDEVQDFLVYPLRGLEWQHMPCRFHDQKP